MLRALASLGFAGAVVTFGGSGCTTSGAASAPGESGSGARGGTVGARGGTAGARGGTTGARGGTGPAGGTSSASGGSAARAGASSGGGGEGGTSTTPDDAGCSAPDLAWRSANATHFTSYPDPGSEECIQYNGCMWAGQFAACDAQKPESWVASHAIVAAFPDFDALRLHDLCLRRGGATMRVTVLDTCGDSDCDGCCTQNRGTADELIDLESFTFARWGEPDGPIEWADLGPTQGDGCN